MNKEVLLATNNKHKLKEYREMLAPLGFIIYSISDLNLKIDVDETGNTYEENAYLKAKALAELSPFPVISDDSGLEITALDNKPGIHTSRFMDEFPSKKDCFDYVINKVNERKNDEARFVCCICYLENKSSKPLYFKGICEGKILPEPCGNKEFGYDPIFMSNQNNLKFGECSDEEKNKVSHRSKALTKLKVFLIL